MRWNFEVEENALVLHFSIQSGHPIYNSYHPPLPHKPLNPLPHPLRTRPLRHHIRLKPKLPLQILPRRRPNSRHKRPPLPQPSHPPILIQPPQHPQHAPPRRRRKHHHPPDPPFRLPQHPPKPKLKLLQLFRLIHNHLIDLHPPPLV